MARQLKTSDVNHLRRLLAWVRCEIPPAPDEVVSIVKSIAPAIDSDSAKRSMVEWHRQSSSVPKYLRAALKALEKHVKEIDGDVVDADTSAARALSHKPMRLAR